jgi:catechol 2,3-dioxygenase-like lactoylglutathione lyase family enzyme
MWRSSQNSSIERWSSIQRSWDSASDLGTGSTALPSASPWSLRTWTWAPQDEHLGYRMIALEVDDMQKAVEYLKTKGTEIVWGPKVREKYVRAEIRDPNGFNIELRQWFHEV